MKKTIKILALHPTHPEIKSVTTQVFDNLLPVLKTKVDVQMIWFVYRPEKIISRQSESLIILDIHDFEDALQVLNTVKPNIVYANADPNLIDYAFSQASKFLNIPVISPFFSRGPNISKIKRVKSTISALLQNSVPTDTESDQKQLMRRGKFFLYKYLFLLRTQKAMKIGLPNIIRTLFILLQAHLHTGRDFIVDVRFANTLHWLDSSYYYKPLIDAGFEKSSIVITGNPMYDPVFQKLQKLKPISKNDNRIRVLFLTNGLYEHGYWTRKQRDTIVRDIISEISKHKTEMSLVVKIHPSSEVLYDYQNLITPIDPTIPVFQKGDVLEFLNEADVVIGFQANSALEYCLISRKPIVICNFYDLKADIFLEKNLAVECRNTSTLILSIHKALNSNPATDEKVNEYIHNNLYKADGKSSERLCNAILDLLNLSQNFPIRKN